MLEKIANSPIGLVLGAGIAGGIAVAVWQWMGRDWLPLVYIPFMLIGYHYRNQYSKMLRVAYTGLLLVIIGIFTVAAFQRMRANIVEPPVWDFHLFWTFGRASAEGMNPYEQDNLLRLAASLNPDESLIAEFYFFHAPPTLFLFAPLGWFDINTAYLVWYVLNGIVLLLNIFLIWRLFADDRSLLSLLFVVGIVMGTAPTITNLYYGQLNFLLLLLVLLLWRDRDKPIAGMWFVLGIFVKPIILILGLYFLLRRRWQSLGIALVTGMVVYSATSLVYGANLFAGYLSNNPIISSMPLYLYNGPVNQSLLATILRLTDTDLGSGLPLLQPLFLIVAAILTLLTAWLVYREREDSTGTGVVLTLALALLIFPKTLTHYSFLLLLPLFLVWKNRETLSGGLFVALAFFTMVEILMRIESGRLTFFAYLLTWCFIAFLMLTSSKSQDRAQDTTAAAENKPFVPAQTGEHSMQLVVA